MLQCEIQRLKIKTMIEISENIVSPSVTLFEKGNLFGTFVEHWIVKFGCPVNLHSDQGLNFMSKFVRSFCSELRIQRSSTTSNHPQGNAMIERTNRTIEECLSKQIGQYQHAWKKFLPLAMMAYRSSIQSVTKYNPAYVVLWFSTVTTYSLHQ